MNSLLLALGAPTRKSQANQRKKFLSAAMGTLSSLPKTGRPAAEIMPAAEIIPVGCSVDIEIKYYYHQIIMKNHGPDISILMVDWFKCAAVLELSSFVQEKSLIPAFELRLLWRQ